MPRAEGRSLVYTVDNIGTRLADAEGDLRAI